MAWWEWLILMALWAVVAAECYFLRRTLHSIAVAVDRQHEALSERVEYVERRLRVLDRQKTPTAL